MIIKCSCDVADLVIHQLGNYWIDIDKRAVREAVPNALNLMKENYEGFPDRRYWNGEEVIFSPYMSTQWMIFLYRLSHVLYLKGKTESADQVYYLNKIMHSNDWFYAVELPRHFYCEHPLGCVLGRASYGDYFFVYQGVTIGGNSKNKTICYPAIGNNVVFCANAVALGDTHIGNNVVISADSYLINEEIPDNCIVFGRSPQPVIKVRDEDEMKKYVREKMGIRE